MKSDNTPPAAVVVNDDPTQLNILAGLLRKEGIYAHAYENAEAALLEMDPAHPPDVIVTDIYMPGIDGWRFCRLLRSPEYKAFNAVPILVVSATFAGDEASRITADLGANAFLPSPVDGRRFIDTLQAIRAGRTPRDILRVLVVEDSKTLAGLLAKRFGAHGYQADVAHDGREASMRFSDAEYNVTVLDYHLPDMKGDTLLHEFMFKNPGCVCVMMTTDPNPHLALEWMKAGAAAYLRKPFDPEYLIVQCDRARRERALLRVEDLLEERTRNLRDREALLARKTDEQRLLLDTIDTQVWYLTDIETYGRLNKAHADFLGLDVNAVAHKRLTEFVSEEVAEVCKASNIEVFQTKKPVHTEEWIPNADGEKRLIAITKTPRLDANGNVEFVVCAGTDITEGKRLEKERLDTERRIHQLEKADSLARMAGSVAHHFNNLMTVVIGNLELAGMDVPQENALSKTLSDAVFGAQRAAELSRLMLTVLGMTQSKRKPADLSKTCREPLAGLRATIPDRVTLEADFSARGPVVNIDTTQMGEVLVALATNAWEAMGDSPGKIRLSVSTANTEDIPDVHRFPVDWEPPADLYACLIVADNGCGMDDQTINRIFDPFYTDKFTGRGLGLPVALGFVKSFGGFITVESGKGKGSVFRVFIPEFRHR